MALRTIKWDRSKGRPEPIRALNRIIEVESGEPLVDLREVAPEIVVMRETTVPFCRKTVAEMALRAARSLPKGIWLGVADAWRPVERQRAIFEHLSQQYLDIHPGASRATVRRVICRWVAPFDQKAPPGHSTGAALDVFLLGTDGEPIDVTSPYDRFSAAPTFAIGLSEQAQKNRDLLVTTMLGVGFSNCRDEYWHYSFGDAGWAVRAGFDRCQYGRIDLPDEYWTKTQELWLKNLRQRPNPFQPASPGSET